MGFEMVLYKWEEIFTVVMFATKRNEGKEGRLAFTLS
jgi:hypothetical protein